MGETAYFDRMAAAPEAEFGFKTAAMLGAELSGDRELAERNRAEHEEEARMRQAARKRDWKGELESLSFDERVDKTMECLDRRASFRNILYGLLLFCGEERTYDEIEEHVQSYAEFEANRQSARRYAFFLQRTGAIEEIELDGEGAVITDERRDQLMEAGADADSIDALVVDWRVRTTEVGARAIQLGDPLLSLKELLEEKPARRSTYAKVLAYCRQPRQLGEIADELKNDPGLEKDERTGLPSMQPSAYVSKLDHAGGLVWNEGWVSTKEGLAILDEMNRV